ncbi:Transposase [Bacteroidales bacterium Barb6]|nr:Transposase [Bacteroidales bacterium Barb6]
MRQIRLTEEEKQQLALLHKTSTNSVVRDRSFCLLLSDKGNSMKAVSQTVNIHWRTVSRLFDAWEQVKTGDKYAALRIASGRGAKVKLLKVMDLLPELAQNHSRNLNPMLDSLEKEHGIKVCKSTLQTFLKEVGIQVETRPTVS